jgi:hypothetical protein
MTTEQKKHVDAFEYWLKTNTENGVSILPESICKDIIAILKDKDGIKALPTVQPETLTDKEQRIFLAAMGREEKVCRQVDDECRDCREPYEDSLVRTCHEITRKVKGALWT